MNTTFETRLKSVLPAINKAAYVVARQSAKYDFDDAKQELIIAVWRSHQSYDTSYNVKFQTYAINRINKRATCLTNTEQHAKTPMPELIEDIDSAAVSEDPTDTILNRLLLDTVEQYLLQKVATSKTDRRAYEIFTQLRADGHKSLGEVARENNISRTRVIMVLSKALKTARAELQL